MSAQIWECDYNHSCLMIYVTNNKKIKQHLKAISLRRQAYKARKACDSYQLVDLASACVTQQQCRHAVYYWGQPVAWQLGKILSFKKQIVSQFTVFMMPLKVYNSTKTVIQASGM